jgi:hypothetical protein
LVDKATLMKSIWPDVAVGDNSLDQVISRLRRVLSQSGARHSCIGTERGRGYRFMADVTQIDIAAVEPPSRLLPGEAGATHPHAHQFYLQARTLSARPGPENLRAASELLQEALTLDPHFAPALAYRALLRTVFVAFDWSEEDALAIAEREARQALEIDPALACGHHGLANVSAARGAWNNAAEHFETACQLEPAPHARVSRIYQLYQSVGHLQRSLRDAGHFDRFAPSQPLGTFVAALSSMLLGRDSDAQRYADRACALGWPRTNPAMQDIYFQLAIRSRRFREATDFMNAAHPRSMRNAGAAAAVDLMCATLAADEERKHAVAALGAVVERIHENELGLVDCRRFVLWLTMLDALDPAFDVINRSLSHFARRGMVGTS